MKRPTRPFMIIASVVAAFLILLASCAFGAVSWARDLEASAMRGKDQAKAGAKSLAAQDATSAIAQFGDAVTSFTAAESMLGPAWIAGLAAPIPWVGRQYSAAASLVAIGRDASEAGAEMALALRETSATPTSEGGTRLGALLKSGRSHIDTALSLLADVSDRISTLTEDGLDPRLAKAVRSLRDALVDVAPFLSRARSLLTIERYLLVAHRRILVVSQNSAELRPTGGFVGSYGILDVGPDGFGLEKYRDVYTLPDPPGRVVPPPGARMTKDFGFRDANWWIDFPTSARAMLGFWTQYEQPPVDGIIAVDVVALSRLLEVYGPTKVPGYSGTFTAQNLLDRLLYLVEVKKGGRSDRKDVLVTLAGQLEQRLLSSAPSELALSGLALATAADEKHVQFYFSDANAQGAVASIGWAGIIAPRDGTTDLLVVSNAMNLPSKANAGVRKAIDYRVALRPDGSAETTLTLDFASTARFNIPPKQSGVFRDYLRVYRTMGTTVSGDTPAAAGSTSTVESGMSVFVRTFSLPRERQHRETIAASVPDAWRDGAAGAGSATSSSSTAASYRLSIIRQADLQDVPTRVTVEAPPGWRIAVVSARMSASGEPIATLMDATTATLSTPLRGDVLLDVQMERL